MTVDELIARITEAGGVARGFGCDDYAAPQALDAATIAALRAPDGGPLPPSLARWLGFDASWLPLFEGGPPRWKLTSVAAFVDAELAEVAEELDDTEDFDLDEVRDAILGELEVLPGGAALENAPAILLPASASQAHLLVFRRDGDAGEAPVLGYEKESFWVKYASFGAFLAHYFAGVEDAS